ncbi:MAG TPA: hypothetical protein VGX92_18045 [Pyrinomonadaceae bacterium]|jgi:hypothetical protein|nr:hypothetical protein [Pyrinomonadaceae bacterium]
MAEAADQENRIRAVVQDELLGILGDARELLGTKDPTGMAKKALDGLANVIRRRQQQQQPSGQSRG